MVEEKVAAVMKVLEERPVERTTVTSPMDTMWIALGLSRPMFLYCGKIDLVGSVAKTGGDW